MPPSHFAEDTPSHLENGTILPAISKAIFHTMATKKSITSQNKNITGRRLSPAVKESVGSVPRLLPPPPAGEELEGRAETRVIQSKGEALTSGCLGGSRLERNDNPKASSASVALLSPAAKQKLKSFRSASYSGRQRRANRFMSRWRHIKSVPTNVDIDVWAVRELKPTGEKCLDQRRWPDVRLVRKTLAGTDQVFEVWQGLPDGWSPTHWRSIPKGPAQ